MRGATTLIPARFLTLVVHLGVLITLLWESQQNTQLCLVDQNVEYHHGRLLGGLAAGVALTLAEILTFMCGITMFSPSICILSTLTHSFGGLCLAYWSLEGLLCDWFWVIFSLSNVLPTSIDLSHGLLVVCGASTKW